MNALKYTSVQLSPSHPPHVILVYILFYHLRLVLYEERDDVFRTLESTDEGMTEQLQGVGSPFRLLHQARCDEPVELFRESKKHTHAQSGEFCWINI